MTGVFSTFRCEERHDDNNNNLMGIFCQLSRIVRAHHRGHIFFLDREVWANKDGTDDVHENIVRKPKRTFYFFHSV